MIDNKMIEIIKKTIHIEDVNTLEEKELKNELYQLSYEGNDYIVYISNEDNKLDELIEYYENNINTIFILIYKNLYEFKADKPQNSNIKKVNTIKNNAIVVYDTEKKFDIEVKGIGENYLEFSENPNIEARIYNIKLYDLHKLYISEGDNLFKENVRKGISAKQKEKVILSNAFKNYFLSSVLNNLTEDEQSKFSDDLKSTWQSWISNKIDIDYDEVKQKNTPNSFWYKHNGISIVCNQADAIKFEKNRISGYSDKVQVVNGAQTISTWSDIFYEMETLEKSSPELYRFMKNTFKKTINQMFVKVSFMIINEANGMSASDIINEITVGLNTQVPVTNVEVFMKEDREFNKLNNIIWDEYKIRIGRAGENFDYKQIFSLKDIVQGWLIYEGQPGKARNLDKDSVTSVKTIKELKEFFSDKQKGNRFVQFLRFQEEIDRWWRSRAKINKNDINEQIKQKIDIDSFVSVVSSNGLNHFKAFIINKEIDKVLIKDEGDIIEELNSSYKKFLLYFKKNIIDDDKLSEEFKPYSSNMFKGNDKKIFDNLIKESDISEIIQKHNNIDVEKLTDDYKNYSKNLNIKANNYMFIDEWLNAEKINLTNIRTIPYYDEKVREAFPLKSSTFMEIAEAVNGEKKISFEDSEFYKEICTEFNIFIFSKLRVGYMKTDFKEYEEDAKKVFNQVVEAFKTGDKNLLKKESDDSSFHIRPKARDSSDVIQFTESEYMTKQTFWVNKKTLKELIRNKASFPHKKQDI
ncbi:hypothetical protein [Clostridium hydrogenum]|uniref:hypothetical protein n=1 Tax=Clostridium hydrogenum TaxID=2855764 RepID=UPI001F3B4F05|nr:hypothetical protein [Clostridium hydrogenum]